MVYHLHNMNNLRYTKDKILIAEMLKNLKELLHVKGVESRKSRLGLESKK